MDEQIDKRISDKLEELEKLLGYKLILCDSFPGIESRSWNDDDGNTITKEWFNVLLEDRYSFSQIAVDLERIAETYPSVIKSVTINGWKRMAIEL